jgi:hypothetical protein
MRRIRVTDQQRQSVVERAQGCCEYCLSQQRYAPQDFTVDHIVPQSLGGQTTLENLALACQGCNGYKSARTEGYDPVDGENVPLYHPRQHRWDEHFTWNEDFTLIVGLTSTGRATVETLRMNRTGAVNLRHVLHEARVHPPDLDDEDST